MSFSIAALSSAVWVGLQFFALVPETRVHAVLSPGFYLIISLPAVLIFWAWLRYFRAARPGRAAYAYATLATAFFSNFCWTVVLLALARLAG